MEQASILMENFPLKTFERKEVLPLASIAAAASICYASYRLFLSNQGKTHGYKEIPVPSSAYPYVGHMMSLGKFPGKTVAKWHKELGPIIKVRMGIQDWIMINDPILAHKVFVTKGAETSYRPHNVYGHDYHNVGGRGVAFSQPDGYWKTTRAAALSVLAPKHIEKYMPTITREAEDLVSRFIKFTELEGEVEPIKHLELNSLNVIATTAFSKRYDTVIDLNFKMLTKVSEFTMVHCAVENDLPNFLPALSIYDYFFGRQAEQKHFVYKERNPFLKQLIKEAENAEGPNIIKSFTEDGFNLSDEEKMGIAADLIAGGTDTTSVTLAWNIAIMCHYPDIQKKAAAEIDSFIKTNGYIPQFKDRENMPYCISIMKECMRYRPTTSFGLAHEAKEDIIIDDYIIPKGSSIISSMESMHMNPNVYPDPEKFKPERFLNNTKTMQSAANGKIDGRDHFNFGWGRRICPAIYLAETELFMAFVQIFSRCYIEPSSEGLPDIDDAISGTLTTAPLAYKVKFIKRTDSLI